MTSPSRPLTMPTESDRSPEVARALAWLQAEQNAAESPFQSSILLHESAVLEERMGDEDAALRHYRAALSLEPRFREPLERLIAAAERHGQLDELLRLYRRLLDGETSDRCRALVECAVLELEQTSDFERAKATLREAAALCPADARPWLLLDLIGHRTSDDRLREEALAARLLLSPTPGYRATLLFDLAELRFRAGACEQAYDYLDEIAKLRTTHTYPALIAATRFALIREEPERLASILRRRIALVEDATSESDHEVDLGIGVMERQADARAYLQLSLSLALGAIGDQEGAAIALENARTLAPEDRVLLGLTLADAELRSDFPRLLHAGQTLAAKLEGPVATFIWFKLAHASLGQRDPQLTRQLVQSGLEQDPRSIGLRTLDVHLALFHGDEQGLAIALETLTDCLADSTSKARWLLAAAGIWALRAKHPLGARSAMAQASRHGLPAELQVRLGRLLALWTGDPLYYAETTTELLEHSQEPIERVDLALELLRVRMAAGDRRQLSATIEHLLDTDDATIVGLLAQLTLSRWLAASSEATDETSIPGTAAVPIRVDWTKEADSWDRLATQCDGSPLAASLRALATVSLLCAGQYDAASARLEQLSRLEPSNLVWAAARVALFLRRNDTSSALRILKQIAEATADATLRASLALHGALLSSRPEDVPEALELLDLASLTHPESSLIYSRWVLRTLSHLSPDVQRRVLDASESLGHPLRRALERFGFELFQCPAAADSIPLPLVPPQELDASIENGVAKDQFGALALLELIKSTDTFEPAESTASPDLREPLTALAAAVRYAEYWQGNEAPRGDRRQLESARDWARVDPSLLSQLEWLMVAREQGDATEEAKARLAVAAHLGPKEAESLRISAQQRRFLAGERPATLLPTTSPAARFANLEISLPGCDPRRRATAIEEGANLLGPSSALLMQANLGFNWIASGDYLRAKGCFEALIEARPSFIPAWLGLRAVADLTRDTAKSAEACAALGDLLSSPQQGSQQWERAATLLLDELGDATRGRLALSRAVALDITQGSAFIRLFRMVREAGDTDELIRLIDARLPHASNDEERILLLWERARALRTQGDRLGALQALDGVTRLAPNHVGALALAGEIHIALGQFDDAARFLAQLSSLPDAPLKQRIMSALAAADLFDKKLGRSNFARDILLDLYRTQPTPTPLRERLAQIAYKIEAYPLAVDVLETLLVDLGDTDARLDAARLVISLCRDKLNQPDRAERAVELVLLRSPADVEAIDLVLSSCFPADRTEYWLAEARDRLRDELALSPLDAPRLEQLAKIALRFDDVRTRQACLGALIAINEGTPEHDAELLQLSERIEPVPNIAIDAIALELLADAQDQGPVSELFAQFASVFMEALGPTLTALGVGKKQRVDPRLGLPLRNEIAAWAGAFGIQEFDLYLTERVEGDVAAIATERPSLVVSTNLVAPLDLRGRQAVARELFALRRGTTLLRHRSPHEIAALVVAACQIGEHPIPSPPYAMKDEFCRLISSALPRKLRKLLAESTAAIQAADPDLGEWVRAASHSLDRIGMLACGDVSQVLSHLTGQRGRLGTSRELQDRTARLIAFAVSPSYLELKDTFGLTVR